MVWGILFGVFVPPFWATVWYTVEKQFHLSRHGVPYRGFLREWTWQAGILIVVWGAFQLWPDALGACASLAIAVIVRWWRRKKRRTAAQLPGAKTRALRDALVRRVRETAIPRPVLAPV